MSRGMMANLFAHEQLLEDVKTSKVLSEPARVEHLQRLQREMMQVRNQLKLWQGKTLKERIEGQRGANGMGVSISQRILSAVLLFPPCICDLIFDAIKIVKYMMDRVSMLHEKA